MQWWTLAHKAAEQAHRRFIVTPMEQRSALLPTEPLPRALSQIESLFRQRILNALPKDIINWVNHRAEQGGIDPSNVLVFYLFKYGWELI